jgi:hypothetical protein
MDIRPHLVKSPIERFMALVKVNPGGCWDWQGSKSKDGYGQFILDGRRSVRRVRISPYRFMWEYCNGPMPEGLEPDHLCNNRKCCNPAHIEPVTHAENQRRSYIRGRKRMRTRPRPTHCPYGHDYAVHGRVNSQNGIICVVCDRRRCAEYQARKRMKQL